MNMEFFKQSPKFIILLFFPFLYWCVDQLFGQIFTDLIYKQFGITELNAIPILIMLICAVIYGIFIGKDYRIHCEPLPYFKRFLNRKIKEAHKNCQSKNIDLELFIEWHKNIDEVLKMALNGEKYDLQHSFYGFQKIGSDISGLILYPTMKDQVDAKLLYSNSIRCLEKILEGIKPIDLESNFNPVYLKDY